MSLGRDAAENLPQPAALMGINRPGLALLGLGHLFDDVNQGAVPAMIPYFIAEHGLTYAAAAGLVLAVTITSSVVQPFLGQASDRRPSPWLIPVGLLCAGGGLALATVMPTYLLIFLALGLCGLGVAAFHPEGARFAVRMAGARRATGMSLFALGGTIGFAAGPLLATPLLLAFGLRGAVFVALPAIATALILARQVPRLSAAPARPSVGAVAAKQAAGADAWWPFVRLTGAVICRSIVFYGMNTFVPLYWLAVLHQSAAAGGAALSLMLVSGAAGTVLGGWLADRYGRRPVVLLGLGLLSPLLAVFLTQGDPRLAMALLVPIGLALYLPFSVMVVMGQEYLPNRVGTASGVTMGLAVSVGGLAAPVLGQIADHSGIGAALTVIAFLPLLATAFAITLPVRKLRPVA